MALTRCFEFVERHPVRGNNAVIKWAIGFDLIQLTIKCKTQIGDIARRHRPLVHANQRPWGHVAAGFLQRFTGTGSNQRFSLVHMPGRLIKAQPRRGFFLDHQKTATSLDQRCNRNAGFPTRFLCIHLGYFTERPEA